MCPKKSLGQHFLVDRNILTKIVSVIGPRPGEVVIEIGAGKGALTEYLLSAGATVVSIEIDKQLVEHLRHRFGSCPNLYIVQGDALKVDYKKLYDEYGRLKIAGNIPYNITSPLIFKMIDNRDFIRSVYFMVQKDVAIRLVAEPGTKDYGILSVVLGLVSDVRINFSVSRNCFRPIPEVDSAFVTISFDRAQKVDNEFFAKFKTVVKTSFGKRRKMLKNSLKEICLFIEGIDFDLNRRPDSMSVEDFVKLTHLIYQ